MKLSDAEVGRQAVSVLTSESRSKWRRLRQQIMSIDANNARSMEMIDSALLVCCLDDFRPESVSAMAADVLHGTYALKNGVQTGTCLNRWFDKLQIVVAEGGSAGVNFEHAAVDGHTVLRYASDVFTDTIIRFAQTISGGVGSYLDGGKMHRTPSSMLSRPRPSSAPRKLDFTLTREIEQAILHAENRLSDAILQSETETLEFTGYGKRFLVQNKLSPDATAQVAMQTAYYKIYGAPANTYESVLTKAYLHGRTEAGRSCTSELVHFAKVFVDDTSSAETKVQALREAVKAHSVETRAAAMGLGVDRHLFALKMLQKKLRLPPSKLFLDPSWALMNTFTLSTSNCGNPSLRFFGFGPVCAQGFGCGYIVKDDAIHMMITSKRRQTKRFRQAIMEFFDEIHDLLIETQPKEAEVVRKYVSKKKSSFDGDGYDFYGLTEEAHSQGGLDPVGCLLDETV